ncbi:potassium channel family protein [Natronoarchaeum sp. GCM10025703]|uniref:potassium channel family protein n=1 Tax=unclassified Natronoarchaeum TaxID=2620183 RepID=UPI0036231A6A
MELWLRRALRTVGAIFVLVLVTSILYHTVMVAVEGREPLFAHSLQVIIETFTGTGYGSDSPWDTTMGNVFVSAVDLSTFLLLFIVVPYVFRPVLEEALGPDAPTATEASDHVVVCGLEQQSDRLVEQFETRDVEYVVVATTESEALSLQEDGISVVHGDPTSVDTLRCAGLDRASAVVVDTIDERTASVILAARELDESVRIIALVADLEFEQHLTYAGADEVLTPRDLLGRRLAERVLTELIPGRSDSISLGEEYSLVELSVTEESRVCGCTVEEIEAMEEPSLTVVGVWQDGEFVDSPPDDCLVDEGTVALVAGYDDDLDTIETEPRGIEGGAIIAGNGIVGSTVRAALESAGVECTTIDLQPADAVDVVGDATDESTLRAANIETTSAFIVAIGDDDQAILTVLVANEQNAEMDTIARATHAENSSKLRRAGADYVLSLPEISGRILVREVLHEEILSYDRQLEVVRISGSEISGQRMAGTSIPALDYIVVAVERDDELLTDISPSFEFRDDDDLLVVGDDGAIATIEGE